jgi:hypothetical protein
LKKMEVEKDSAGLMSPPLAGGRDSEREVILPQGHGSTSATAAAVWTLPALASMIAESRPISILTNVSR